MDSDRVVAISTCTEPIGYPKNPPFYPGEPYPEHVGRVPLGNEVNITYRIFRELMLDLNMDAKRFGTPDWNPLGEIIRPGQKILIKPNLVQHLHGTGGDYHAVVTHGSLIRCVLDYVGRALEGKGEITVGDAPLQSADFVQIIDRTGLQKVCDNAEKIWRIPVRLVDFRLWSVQLGSYDCIKKGDFLEGDAKGYVSVNLGKRSLLAPLGGQSDRFRVTNYNCFEMEMHHNTIVHEYLIPRTVLNADVIINLPKLKTHRKVGLTAALKNLVGINGHKDWLPHHRYGSVIEGGDEYKESSFLKRLQTYLSEKNDGDLSRKWNFVRHLMIRSIGRVNRYLASDPFLEGSWYGNDTLWRTVLDLNRLVLYADREGKMTNHRQRQYIAIVDAIIAGEGEGPMEPDARHCGILLGGSNPVCVDAVSATMVGFDYEKIPLISNGFKIKEWPLVDFKPDEIVSRSRDHRWQSLRVGNDPRHLSFTPPMGWVGQIECKERHRKHDKSEQNLNIFNTSEHSPSDTERNK